MEADHNLVIIGGGVAGLDIATHLAGKHAHGRRLNVTLIDRETAYVWKPMLHTIAAGTSEASAQQTVYAAQAARLGFRYELGEALAIDRQACMVQLAAICVEGEEIVPERAIAYDTLVLTVGSRANDFGTAGAAEHAARIDSRSDAMAFNDRLRAGLVKSTLAGRPLTVGIVGGGATGVELAAELIQIAGVIEQYGIARASEHLKVVLIEAGPRLLGTFPERLGTATRSKLEQLGVIVRTETKVSSVEETGFELNSNEHLPVDLKCPSSEHLAQLAA